MNYFKVTCRCGHVGRNNYIPIIFPIIASNGKEASSIARNIPRVKHNHKYAIIDCKKISKIEYDEIKEINDNDPYLRCKNKREQKLIKDFENRIICPSNENVKHKRIKLKALRKERCEYNEKKNKEIIKLMKEMYDEE